MFLELQTRSWCYASNMFLEYQTRSRCYASNMFLELQTRSWCYASNMFLELQTCSWCYAFNMFLELQTRSRCYVTCSWNFRHALDATLLTCSWNFRHADDVQKKIVLSNSKTLIFTPKISKSLRRHNARHFFEISECRLYHGQLKVVRHVVILCYLRNACGWICLSSWGGSGHYCSLQLKLGLETSLQLWWSTQ